MSSAMIDVGLILGAYLLGAVPFAYIVTKAVAGIDIRTVGSGNVGATNVSRVLGRKWGIFVFTLDVLKGFVPTAAAQLAHGRGLTHVDLPWIVPLVGLVAIAGHNWPVYLKFKGGKGVATSAGVFLGIFPIGCAIALAVWAVMAAITRYVSLSSIIAAVALVVSAFLLQKDHWGSGKYLTSFVILAAVMTIWRHRSNMQRLMKGTEGKIGQKKSEATGEATPNAKS